MGIIKDQSGDVYRDSVTAGVPASGPNEPVKSEIRALFATVETQVAAAAAAVSGDGIEAIVAAVQPLVDDAETARDQATAARDEIRALKPLLLSSLSSLGDMAPRASIAASLRAGASALPKGIRFSAGGGNGSILITNAIVDEVAKAMLPVGTSMRVRQVMAGSAGFSTGVGAPNPSEATFVVYDDGSNNRIGSVDTAQSRFVSDTIYVSETTLTWASNIAQLGRFAPFNSVQSFSGNIDVTVAGLVLLIDALPAPYAITAADLVRDIERERIRRGYALQIKSANYPDVGVANASLASATAQSRQQIVLKPGIEANKVGILPDYTDLIGSGSDISRIIYSGSATLTDNARPQFEPITVQRNSIVRGVSIRTRNSNYVHSESGNTYQDWTQLYEDCVFRHDGNEEAFANGGLSEGSRYVQAFGCGMSSGATLTHRRINATSFRGGGAYFHNANGQAKSCHILLENSTYGGEDQVSPDLTFSTLGSGTVDTVELNGVSLVQGIMGYGVSGIPQDPMRNFAAHTDLKIYGRNVSPHILLTGDTGRALRIRGNTPGGGSVQVSGEAATVLFDGGLGLGTFRSGDTDKKPEAIGVMDVAGHTIGQRVDLLTGARRLIVTVNGTSVTYTFGANATATSNAAHLSAINTAIASIGSADLVNPGEDYRPTMYDQEINPINMGPVPIHQGTLVIYYGHGNLCRSAEPTDFSNGQLVDPKANIGVALEYIGRGLFGRVQYRGYINWAQLVGWEDINTQKALATGSGDGLVVGEGMIVFTNADGVHGTIRYGGTASSTLRCIQGEVNNGRGRSIPRVLLVA